MADAKSIDKDGKWFVNTAQFRFAHGERAGVVFEPGVPTRVKPDGWIEGQPLIVEVSDPYGDLPAQIGVETPLKGGSAAPAAKTTGKGTGSGSGKK